jgi:hypothetical protein
MLSWTAPATGLPTSYGIEAAVSPGGAPVVAFNTGTTQTSLVVPNVAVSYIQKNSVHHRKNTTPMEIMKSIYL